MGDFVGSFAFVVVVEVVDGGDDADDNDNDHPFVTCVLSATWRIP